jgi:hypothetical protein
LAARLAAGRVGLRVDAVSRLFLSDEVEQTGCFDFQHLLVVGDRLGLPTLRLVRLRPAIIMRSGFSDDFDHAIEIPDGALVLALIRHDRGAYRVGGALWGAV